MSEVGKTDYVQWLGAVTPEDVYRRVAEWSGGLTERQHLVRSIVLDLGAQIEHRLQQILYAQLSRLVWGADTKALDELSSQISRMGYAQVFRLLQPALKAFEPRIAQDVQEIHKLRNGPAHGDVASLQYQNRDLVTDHEALAELFVRWSFLNKQLNGFVEKTIDDSKELERVGRNVYLDKPNPLKR
jgi:hypothetical protein